VKSARVMKKLSLICAILEAEKSPGRNRRAHQMATVKGDVHDIGKNIGVVLHVTITTCGSWVMVPAKILETVREKTSDDAFMSDTPSLTRWFMWRRK
jgi:cobalamin-dependent methionine synthase I